MDAHALVQANLDDLAILEVSGPDAAAFLQSQLTQDISSGSPWRAQLAGYCSAKGRLLASMIVWQGAAHPDAFFLLLKRDIAIDVATRLARFVLRARVVITHAPTRVAGVMLSTTDGAGKSLAANGFPLRQLVTWNDDQPSHFPERLLTTPFQPYSIVHDARDTWIAAPIGRVDTRRWWRIGATTAVPAPRATDSEDGAGADPTPPAQYWQASDITAGLGWVVAATQELFIPQTLNFDLAGGLSFTKGCYPGQEIVARSHYRGTIKRRMARGAVLASSAAPIRAHPAADIYTDTHGDAPRGRVINVAQLAGRTEILFEASLADFACSNFRLSAAGGPAIELAALPYAVA